MPGATASGEGHREAQRQIDACRAARKGEKSGLIEGQEMLENSAMLHLIRW
jgi:hypothetical protein